MNPSQTKGGLIMDNPEIIDAVAVATKILDEIFATNFPGLRATRETILKVETGRAYTRLVKIEINRATGEQMTAKAWGFVKNDDLTLWKACGWKAPIKNKVRGVVADLTNPQKVNRWRYGIE